MTNIKSTKRALLSSVLALFLCFAMLLGTTYAWFTDSVTSGNNRIVAGTLSVDLKMDKEKNGTYTSIADGNGDIFKEADVATDSNATLWEPGKTQVAYLAIENTGKLELKYKVALNVEDAGKALYEVMEYEIVPNAKADNDLVKPWTDGNSVVVGTQPVSDETPLAVGATHYFALVIHMNEDADNKYMGGEVNFDITVLATQNNVESDSFGTDYDANASFDGEVVTVDELKALIENGGSAKLANDLTLDSEITLAAGKSVDLDLNGKTLTGNVVIADGAALSVSNGTVANIDNSVSAIQTNGGDLTLNNVTIESARHGVRAEGGNVVINGGIYKVAPDSKKTLHAVNVSDGATLTINGGTFVGPKGTMADSGAAVNVQAGSTATIYGGNFSGGKNNTLSAAGTLKVVGGTFDQDPTNFATGSQVVNNGDGTWTVKPHEVSSNDDLVAAIAGGNQNVSLGAGTYEFPSIPQGTTIIGQEGVVFEDTLSGTLDNVTIKNVHIKDSNAQRWAYSKGTLVFENCTFEATSVYAIHYDGLNGANITYKNCTIIGWAAIGHGAEHITFDGCQIYGNGSYGVLRLYSPATIKNCTFDVSAVNTTDVYQDGIHAVDCEIKVSNNVNVNGDMEDIYNISGTGTIIEE